MTWSPLSSIVMTAPPPNSSPLVNSATPGIVTGLSSGTINKLLYSGGASPLPPQATAASFYSSCSGLTCSFNATASVNAHGPAAARLTAPAIDVVVAATVDPVVGPFRRAAREGAVALLAGTALALLIAHTLTRRLTGTLSRLANAADALAAGNLGAVAEVRGRDEVARVARAFNLLGERLRTLLEERSRREALADADDNASEHLHPAWHRSRRLAFGSEAVLVVFDAVWQRVVHVVR